MTITLTQSTSTDLPKKSRYIFNVVTSEFMSLFDSKNPALSEVREEELDGRKYLVVPMVMLTEGVHTGSSGAIYYPPSELATSPKQWNFKPIVLEHPFNNGSGTDLEVYKKQAVGKVMNTYYADGKLKAEAWLDLEKVLEKCPLILDHIKSGLPMEVSTGLLSEIFLEDGKWRDERYSGRIAHIRADHLAILPRVQGACSISDGAGLLVNQAYPTKSAQTLPEQPKTTYNAFYLTGDTQYDNMYPLPDLGQLDTNTDTTPDTQPSNGQTVEEQPLLSSDSGFVKSEAAAIAIPVSQNPAANVIREPSAPQYQKSETQVLADQISTVISTAISELLASANKPNTNPSQFGNLATQPNPQMQDPAFKEAHQELHPPQQQTDQDKNQPKIASLKNAKAVTNAITDEINKIRQSILDLYQFIAVFQKEYKDKPLSADMKQWISELETEMKEHMATVNTLIDNHTKSGSPGNIKDRDANIFSLLSGLFLGMNKAAFESDAQAAIAKGAVVEGYWLDKYKLALLASQRIFDAAENKNPAAIKKFFTEFHSIFPDDFAAIKKWKNGGYNLQQASDDANVAELLRFAEEQPERFLTFVNKLRGEHNRRAEKIHEQINYLLQAYDPQYPNLIEQEIKDVTKLASGAHAQLDKIDSGEYHPSVQPASRHEYGSSQFSNNNARATTKNTITPIASTMPVTHSSQKSAANSITTLVNGVISVCKKANAHTAQNNKKSVCNHVIINSDLSALITDYDKQEQCGQTTAALIEQSVDAESDPSLANALLTLKQKTETKKLEIQQKIAEYIQDSPVLLVDEFDRTVLKDTLPETKVALTPLLIPGNSSKKSNPIPVAPVDSLAPTSNRRRMRCTANSQPPVTVDQISAKVQEWLGSIDKLRTTSQPAWADEEEAKMLVLLTDVLRQIGGAAEATQQRLLSPDLQNPPNPDSAVQDMSVLAEPTPAAAPTTPPTTGTGESDTSLI